MQPEDNKEIIHYGQTPDELTQDKKISGNERDFFQYCHSLKGDKDFRENPNPVRKVNRKEAAKVLGVTERTITRWTNKLENRGWISIRYQGSKGYIIILHTKRKRRKKMQK